MRPCHPREVNISRVVWRGCTLITEEVNVSLVARPWLACSSCYCDHVTTGKIFSTGPCVILLSCSHLLEAQSELHLLSGTAGSQLSVEAFCFVSSPSLLPSTFIVDFSSCSCQSHSLSHWLFMVLLLISLLTCWWTFGLTHGFRHMCSCRISNILYCMHYSSLSHWCDLYMWHQLHVHPS